MKLVKTPLRSRINDINLARLMRIAIEGPELSIVDFNEVMDVFKIIIREYGSTLYVGMT